MSKSSETLIDLPEGESIVAICYKNGVMVYTFRLINKIVRDSNGYHLTRINGNYLHIFPDSLDVIEIGEELVEDE
jgi:hypothetical protein